MCDAESRPRHDSCVTVLLTRYREPFCILRRLTFCFSFFGAVLFLAEDQNWAGCLNYVSLRKIRCASLFFFLRGLLLETCVFFSFSSFLPFGSFSIVLNHLFDMMYL